jgi:hypothetical protein
MTPEPSSRFRRAAAAELDRLTKARERALQAVEAAERALASARGSLETIEDRLALLRSISDPEFAGESRTIRVEPVEGEGTVLRGAAIREAAVEVLFSSPLEGRAPIHYRRWFELFQQAGYRVSGKRPEAVFLSQISRSPVVRSTTKEGIYELDRGASDRLQGELQKLEAELRRITQEPVDGPEDLARRRERQEELTTEIRRKHKQLEEALRTLAARPAAEAA